MSIAFGQQPQSRTPYPDGPQRPRLSAAMSQGIWALLSDPLALVAPADFSSFAAGCQSVTRICGQLTTIVNAASTSVILVQAIRNNTPGFALMVGLGVVTSAAQAAGVNPNNIVGSAVQRVNDLVQSPIKFLEQAFRARSYAQASFTGNGMADLFKALGSVSGLLIACRTFIDLISGGITANFGPGAANTEAGKRLAAQNISISGSQIRAGLLAVTQAMRDIGTLWDPNVPRRIGTPAGLILSLRAQGIIEEIGLREALLEESVFLDDDDDVIYTSPYTLLQALKKIKGTQLKIIIERTRCNLAKPSNVLTAADLCKADNIISQQALDNIPYGNIEEIGVRLATLTLRSKVTWELLADTLDQLDLPDIALINNPSFASDMSSLAPYLGYGNGLFKDATLRDLIGTAGGAAHTQAYQLLLEANDALQSTPEGKALLVALAYYDLHKSISDPLQPIAETNLIAALEAVKNSSNVSVQEAAVKADKNILDSAIQLVSEITNAVATGYAIYQTVAGILSVATAIGTAIAGTAASMGSDGGTAAAGASNTGLLAATKFPEGFWSFTNGIKAVINVISNIIDAVGDATGITDLLLAMANPNTRGGQAIRAMVAETRNQATLRSIGLGIPDVDIEEEARKRRARFGFGLTLEQQNIISNYGINNFMGAPEIEEMIFINAYYGYQRHFFENFAGLYEGFRARAATNT
jgi:hypothetical protein